MAVSAPLLLRPNSLCQKGLALANTLGYKVPQEGRKYLIRSVVRRFANMSLNQSTLTYASRRFGSLRLLAQRFRSGRLSLIEDEQLTELLKQTDHWDDLAAGRILCSQCGQLITLENVSGFIVTDGSYQFLCDSQLCFSATTSA